MPRKSQSKKLSGFLVFLLLFVGLIAAAYLLTTNLDIRQKAFNRNSPVSATCQEFVKVASRVDRPANDVTGVLGEDGYFYPVSVIPASGTPSTGALSSINRFPPTLIASSSALLGVTYYHERLFDVAATTPNAMGNVRLYVGSERDLRRIIYNPMVHAVTPPVESIRHTTLPNFTGPYAQAITVDEWGNVYVLWVYSNPTPTYKVDLMKYDANGAQQPGYPVDLTGSTHDKIRYPISMAYNKINQQLIITDMNPQGNPVPKIRALRTDGSYSADDNIVWVHSDMTPTAKVATDDLGYVYISSSFPIEGGNTASRIDKYTKDGMYNYGNLLGLTPEIPGADGNVNVRFWHLVKGFSVDSRGYVHISHVDMSDGVAKDRISIYGCASDFAPTPTPTPTRTPTPYPTPTPTLPPPTPPFTNPPTPSPMPQLLTKTNVCQQTTASVGWSYFLGATGYEVWRCMDLSGTCTNFSKVATVSSRTRSYSQKLNINPAYVYRYKIRAVLNGGLFSQYTNIQNLTYYYCSPGIPPSN